MIKKNDWYSTIETMLDTYSTDTVRLYMTKTWKQVVDLPKDEYSIARKKYLSKYKRVKMNITKDTIKDLIDNITYKGDFDSAYFMLNLMFINPDLDYVRKLQKHTYPTIVERILDVVDKDIDMTKFVNFCTITKSYEPQYIFTNLSSVVYTKQYCYDVLKEFDFKLQDTKYFYIKYILPNYPTEEFKEYNKYYLQELINICKNI
jgi:hypothetical protein